MLNCERMRCDFRLQNGRSVRLIGVLPELDTAGRSKTNMPYYTHRKQKLIRSNQWGKKYSKPWPVWRAQTCRASLVRDLELDVKQPQAISEYSSVLGARLVLRQHQMNHLLTRTSVPVTMFGDPKPLAEDPEVLWRCRRTRRAPSKDEYSEIACGCFTSNSRSRTRLARQVWARHTGQGLEYFLPHWLDLISFCFLCV
jgi:hypothetical protein